MSEGNVKQNDSANAAEEFLIREYDEEPGVTTNHTPASTDDGVSISREYIVQHHNDTSKNGSNHQHSAVEISETALYTRRRWLRAPWSVAKELFLPIGYPSTVHTGYLEYQFYDSLQGLCSYLRGVLCSAQVLQAAGVGNDQATAWAAALTWALKDGVGMTSGLLFSYLAAPLFDAHVKEFRLFADFINNVALTLDMLAPYSPSLLLVTSASTVCKTLCGLSAAATKASITHYFATTGNMADLNAKEATQETLVSLIGMLLGVSLARQLQQLEHEDSQDNEMTTSTSQIIQWAVFALLTAIHMWANLKGVYLLRLSTLNRQRAELVLRTMIRQEDEPSTTLIPLKSLSEIDFSPPSTIFESLLTSTRKMLWPGQLHLNARLVDMMRAAAAASSSLISYQQALIQQLQAGTATYVIQVIPRPGDKIRCIQVCLLRGASHVDELQAFCHALVLQWHGTQVSFPHPDTVRRYGQILEGLFHPRKEINQPSVVDQLKQNGWQVDDGRLYLGFPRRRTEWMAQEKKTWSGKNKIE